jgi:hypothetical protein
MRHRIAIALFLAPILGCFVQVENPALTLTHSLCTGGTNCVPGFGANLTLIQVNGQSSFTVDFGNQPLLKSSSALGPATLNTSLLLNEAMFDMKTANANFKQVTKVSLLAASQPPATPGADPCQPASNCTVIAAFDAATDGGAPDQRIVLKGNSSDLLKFINATTHQLILQIQAQGQAPSPPAWNADVSMDMGFKSRANFP